MLTIRDEQIRALSLVMFERWLQSHLRQYFPKQCAGLTDAELRQTVRTGIARGRRYGFVHEADLCRFTDILLVMGADFDSDPRLPWAAAILNDPGLARPGVRIEMLQEAAAGHLRKLAEPPAPEPVEDDVEEIDEDDDEEEEYLESAEEEEEPQGLTMAVTEKQILLGLAYKGKAAYEVEGLTVAWE
jgi:hypothetical protein